MPKNYYIILGIPADSTKEEIKAAYRKLAKEYHPDHYGDDNSPFQRIQEAYSVLSDPRSRTQYDGKLTDNIEVGRRRHYGQREYGGHRVEPLIPEAENYSGLTRPPLERSVKTYRSVFDNLFDSLISNYSEYNQLVDPQLDMLSVEVSLDIEQARSGGNIRLIVPFETNCPSCYTFSPFPGHNCWRCNGTGVISGDKAVVISYPPGIPDNHMIQICLNPYEREKKYLSVSFRVS